MKDQYQALSNLLENTWQLKIHHQALAIAYPNAPSTGEPAKTQLLRLIRQSIQDQDLGRLPPQEIATLTNRLKKAQQFLTFASQCQKGKRNKRSKKYQADRPMYYNDTIPTPEEGRR